MFYWASLSAHNHTGCIPSSFTALFVSERCPYRCQPLYKISRLPGLRASAWWSQASGMDSFLRCPLHHPLGSWDGWLASGCAALTSACSLLLQALLLSTLFAPSARLSHLIGAKEVPRETEGSVNVKEMPQPNSGASKCICMCRACFRVCVCVFITLLCWGCYYLLMVRFKMQHHISRWYNNASLFHPLYLSDTHTPTHTRIYAAC